MSRASRSNPETGLSYFEIVAEVKSQEDVQSLLNLIDQGRGVVRATAYLHERRGVNQPVQRLELVRQLGLPEDAALSVIRTSYLDKVDELTRLAESTSPVAASQFIERRTELHLPFSRLVEALSRLSVNELTSPDQRTLLCLKLNLKNDASFGEISEAFRRELDTYDVVRKFRPGFKVVGEKTLTDLYNQVMGSTKTDRP